VLIISNIKIWRNKEGVNMTKIIHSHRIYGDYKYSKCPACKTEIEVGHPVELNLPYCENCRGIVLDAAQLYCCWCGEPFEN
jgi:NAD-dependent SIR2 family protein deacetylase